jgi:hypothetical protein
MILDPPRTVTITKMIGKELAMLRHRILREIGPTPSPAARSDADQCLWPASFFSGGQ